MKKKSPIVTIITISLLMSFAMFLLITQIFGVPFWWIFRILPLSTVQRPKLLIKVSPETPFSIGEKITVTVTNSSSQLPVEDAQVSVTKDGINITLYTDSQGQAFFEYPGEVTIVRAQKSGIEPSIPVAIPKAPDKWVRDTFWSLGIAIIGGIASGTTTYMLKKRK